MLADAFGRVVRNLRISVTDRCNLRCLYCMPAEPHWMLRGEILTFEEIHRLARVFVSLGVEKIRLTGGEPTLRRDLPALVRMVACLDGVKDLSLTTNAMLLKQSARALWDAGLRRINVSLDTLQEDRFEDITRREAFRRVWAGIEEAERVGFSPLKVNVVVMRGYNEDELEAIARLGRERSWQVRFIEFMPLDGDGVWSRDKVVPAREILDRLSAVAPVEEAPATRGSDPARRYRFRDGGGEFGIIASVTEPFCDACDRIRLTADGKLRTCLFSTWETDLKGPLRSGASDEDLCGLIRGAVLRKEAGHGINSSAFRKPERAMYSIGG